nr:MAG TPA: hypothetical protein [Caudoviricetes sp.]
MDIPIIYTSFRNSVLYQHFQKFIRFNSDYLIFLFCTFSVIFCT